RASRSVISSSYLEGMSGSPSSLSGGSLRNPADFHIKPLADGSVVVRSSRCLTETSEMSNSSRCRGLAELRHAASPEPSGPDRFYGARSPPEEPCSRPLARVLEHLQVLATAHATAPQACRA